MLFSQGGVVLSICLFLVLRFYFRTPVVPSQISAMDVPFTFVEEGFSVSIWDFNFLEIAQADLKESVTFNWNVKITVIC